MVGSSVASAWLRRVLPSGTADGVDAGLVGALTLAVVATVILLRHGRSEANGSGILAGRAAGVSLDATGTRQAAGLVDRLAVVPVCAVVCSPLLRCRETVESFAEQRGLELATEQRLVEVDYGDWTGRAVKDLAEESLWSVVQQHPSAAVFPGGEGLAQVQARAVAAVREWDAWVASEYGDDAVWVACTHGDVIKSVLIDALGGHLDGFQRIVVEPGSVSAVRYTTTRPFVLRMNDTAGDLSALVPHKESTADAVVGGSTGSDG